MADFMGAEEFTTAQQIQYAAAFKARFHDKTLITRLTNGEWKGKFKGAGTTLKVPCLPIFTTQRRVKGDKVEYADLKTYEETFTINRERSCAFKLEDEDQEFSAISLEGPFIQEQTRQMSEDVDTEFLADVYAKCHASNCGNTAGFRSEAYTLGTAAKPVKIYKTDSLAATGKAADTGSTFSHLNATEFVTSMISTLEEMPGGLDATPYVVVQTSVAHLLQNSDLSKSDWMGDNGVSTIRKNVQYLGKIGGADIIVCNQLPMWTKTVGSGSVKEYLCLFGDTSAVTYADEIMRQEKIRDKDDYADYFRARMVYDWFVRYPERIGYGLCALA